MHTIAYLNSVTFGAGAIGTLKQTLSELRILRPLVVSDRGILATGLLARLADQLSAQADNFLDVPTNPTERAVRSGLDQYKRNGCDGLIAFGGGSSIDLAKGISLLAGHSGPLETYAAINGGTSRITAATAPLIAIPTTAGTGSEVGRGSLLSLDDERKLAFVSPHLVPRRAICDPELTIGLPRHLTAATGLDALSHCVETFLSTRYNPPAEAIAIDGFTRIWQALPRACADGSDIDARSEMMMGAMQGGLAFQKGLGAVHSLSHALGGLKSLSLHHGTLNAILMPPVMRWNAPAVGTKMDKLCKAIDLPTGSSLANAIEDLNKRVGLPSRLSEIGVTGEMVDAVVVRAMNDHSNQTTPRKLTESDYRELFFSVL